MSELSTVITKDENKLKCKDTDKLLKIVENINGKDSLLYIWLQQMITTDNTNNDNLNDFLTKSFGTMGINWNTFDDITIEHKDKKLIAYHKEYKDKEKNFNKKRKNKKIKIIYKDKDIKNYDKIKELYASGLIIFENIKEQITEAE
jgi:hypothetical protein